MVGDALIVERIIIAVADCQPLQNEKIKIHSLM